MTTYFTTDLDGSGQTVAVADSGLDEDHGDFGTRVVGNYDVIGDGSTADKHSGHGTHVACTVLGDGFRGGYGGVAQAADLYFQAMENDNTGKFPIPFPQQLAQHGLQRLVPNTQLPGFFGRSEQSNTTPRRRRRRRAITLTAITTALRA